MPSIIVLRFDDDMDDPNQDIDLSQLPQLTETMAHAIGRLPDAAYGATDEAATAVICLFQALERAMEMQPPKVNGAT